MKKIKLWKFTPILALVSLGIAAPFIISNTYSPMEKSGFESDAHAEGDHVVFNEHVENELDFPQSEEHNDPRFFDVPHQIQIWEHRYSGEEDRKRKLLIDADLTPETADTFSNCFISDEKTLVGLTWWGRNEENFLPIPSHVNAIGANAFRNCSGPKNIFIPNWVEKIDKDAFKQPGADHVTDTGTKYYVFNTSNKKNLLKAGINTKQIFEVEKNFIFQNAEILELTETGRNATTITIPSHIRIIGHYAFYHCERLENVYMLNDFLYGGVKHISSYAFAGCLSLTNINLPESLESIGMCAFSGCRLLESIKIPANVSYISFLAFDYCNNLRNVINNSGVLFDWWVQNHEYDGEVLRWWSNIDLNKFTNSKNKPFTTIIEHSLADCNLMKNLILSNDIKIINSLTFQNCNALVHLEIPYGVEEIRDRAFNNCKSLAKITIFNDNLTLGSDPFQNCSFSAKFYVFTEKMQEVLKSILRHEQEIILINHFIFNQDVLIGLTQEGKRQSKITIPYGVSSIASNAFEGCTVLKEIIIPASVQDIDQEDLFKNCPLLESVVYQELNNI